MGYIKRNFDPNNFCLDDVIDVIKAKAKNKKAKEKEKKKKAEKKAKKNK